MLLDWRDDQKSRGYRGSRFVRLTNGRAFLPTHAKGSVISSEVGDGDALAARAVRFSTVHAPIGKYRRDFYPGKPLVCPTCTAFKTRERAILFLCPRFGRSGRFSKDGFKKTDRHLAWISKFLGKNPNACAFDFVLFQPP
ncbi:hypothetical protein BD779DRAFT_465865 [Infundibulicybe gibba]|nr:hypothetical protein BD779DRAFT_465865 [Infundibulicybe gibba]